MYYNVCPDCGANLDPGEKCDCRKEKMRREEAYRRMMVVDKTHQYKLNLGGMYEKTSA